MESGQLSHVETTELSAHKRIYLSTCRSFSLYCARHFDSCHLHFMQKYMGTKNRRLIRLYKKAQDRIENELDVIKIVKHIRELKILAKNSLMNIMTRFQIDHSNKNVINMQSDEGGCSSSSSCCDEGEKEMLEVEKYILAQSVRRDIYEKFDYEIGRAEGRQRQSIGECHIANSRQLARGSSFITFKSKQRSAVRQKLAEKMYAFMSHVQKLVDKRNT